MNHASWRRGLGLVLLVSVIGVGARAADGDLVAAGSPLGTVVPDGSHCAPSTCVHWGVRVGADYVDPLSLLPGAGPVVLLPLDDRGAG